MKSTLLIGDCRVKLKEIPDESVDCVVTSPPYWGLRDYKTEPLIWDGIDGCEHEWGSEMFKISQPRPDFSHNVRLMTRGTQKSSQATEMKASYGMFCQKCGAWRGQLGLEPDPNLYIKHLCDIFDEVKRVLKKSGTCWVVIGDTYSSGTKGSGGTGKQGINGCDCQHFDTLKVNQDCPDKCLVQIPSRFGLEMVNRGWILRNEIIWHKPNCMPSSVKDRFTIDFEKVFFFVKSKKYYFKQQLEPMKEESALRYKYAFGGEKNTHIKETDNPTYVVGDRIPTNLRNKRAIWTISTRPYSGSHFAVFPLDLIAPMIDSGCPPGGTVLDPFCGSGTVLEYARKHGLNGIGIELNPNYEKLVAERALLNTLPLN